MSTLIKAWGAIRASLEKSNFNDIKTIVGLGGINLGALAHLVQKSGSEGATKGQLMTAIDGEFAKIVDQEKSHFLGILGEEILRRRPDMEQDLSHDLARLGWEFSVKVLLPIDVFDPKDLVELSEDARQDLLNAAKRFRDGDLSGAISSACAAVDSVISAVYQEHGLGHPNEASFQERCKKAALAKGVVPVLEEQLKELGWLDKDIKLFKNNFEGALNQGAFVMQTLRSKMGDVHGTKPVLKPLVFDSIKWAGLLVRSLSDT